MSYDTWHHGCRHKPSSETGVLREVVAEHKYSLDLIAALAPSRLEDETQLVMDRLLRECLKRRPVAR